jgi:putative ABC transport system permease protein
MLPWDLFCDLFPPEPNDPKADPYLTVPQLTIFGRELLRRMNAIPGVELAAITSGLPATTHNDISGLAVTALAIEDRLIDSSEDLRAESIRISPDYFRVMQVPLVRSRFFTEEDEDGKLSVTMIDETTARRYWPGRNPLGRRIRMGQNAKLPWWIIIGIVKDIKNDGLDVDGVPHIYVPLYQSRGRSLSVVLRTSL